MAHKPVFTTSKKIRVGLGDAMQRLMSVELRLMNGLAEVEEKDLAQRQLIIDALNLTQLDLGFDCNEDGTPDTIDIFEQAADTSCCRVVTDAEACCRVPSDSSTKTKKAKGKSRSTDKADKGNQTPEAPAPVIEIVTPRMEETVTPSMENEEKSTKKEKKQKGFFSNLFGTNEE